MSKFDSIEIIGILNFQWGIARISIGSVGIMIVGILIPTWFHSVDCLHGPLIDDGMTPYGMLDPLGLASGPAGVENVQRFVCLYGHTVVRSGCRHLQSGKV